MNTEKKRTILIVHHGQGVGGGLIALLGLIDELKAESEVHVLSVFDGIAVEYLRRAGVKVIVPKSRFYSKFYALWIHSEAAYSNLIDFFRQFRHIALYFLSRFLFAPAVLRDLVGPYDIVYLNSTFISDWAVAARKFNKPVVIHVREPLAKGYIGLRRSIIIDAIRRSCVQVIAVSIDNAMRIGLPTKTAVVYDPVVTAGRDSTDVTAGESSPTQKYFVYVGGMARIKGFEDMVNALELLDDDVRIFFLGGEVAYATGGWKRAIRNLVDPYYGRSEMLLARLKKSARVEFVGLTDDVFFYYRKAHGLICPFSKPHAALPILEAFSVGKPVVASNICGMSELVTLQNGMFFDSGDAASLAATVNAMAALPRDRYESMCVASFDTYRRLREKNINVASIINGL